MLNWYLILAFGPLIVLVGYMVYKFILERFVDAYLERSRIGKVIDAGIAKIEDSGESLVSELGDDLDKITEQAMSSVEEAKMLIFNLLYKLNNTIIDFTKTVWHYLMHFFVLVMRLVRDVSDWAYTRSRDRFVETAAKERKSVRRFWKHLKEYKKESDSEE